MGLYSYTILKVSLQARFSLVSRVKLSIVTYIHFVYHKLAKCINTLEKKDLLIHTLNGLFSEHPTHHVFCNIYLLIIIYFFPFRSDETIIRMIPKCHVSKWSESSNVFSFLYFSNFLFYYEYFIGFIIWSFKRSKFFCLSFFYSWLSKSVQNYFL